MHHKFCLAALIFGAASFLAAQTPAPGLVAGTLVDPAGKPVTAGAVVTLQGPGNAPPRTAATDPQGRFAFAQVLPGNYTLHFGGATAAEGSSVPIVLDAQRTSLELGRLALPADSALLMQKFEVSARQEAVYNSIDRKVYNVGKDLTSTTGSASDLLQNVPSVQVDVEGNISLRGDSGVQILINGKPSAMLGGNRAAVLEQMPADSIERVEVITNPSAKYKPDGTGGIINLVLKRERTLGHTGSIRVNAGNDERYNAGISGSYNPGDYTLHGRLSLRQDDRQRSGNEARSRFDDTGNLVSSTAQTSTESSRPLSRVARIGADFNLGKHTKIGTSLDYDERESEVHSTETNLTRDAAGVLTRDYDRIRTGPSGENEFELKLTFEHAFDDKDRELTAEFSHGRSKEDEEERNTNVYRLPGILPTSDLTLTKNAETETNLSADYSHPLAADAKFELGYEFEREKSDSDFRASSLDPVSNLWVVDTRSTNRFVHDSTINALYATYGRPIGQFGFLAGLRYEHADIKTRQVTSGLANRNDYGRVYPSLHFSYRLSDAHQLQLSYSHRVNRPDGDDLNPFPEYDDPLDQQAGNPNLVPEDTHSIEGGWQYEQGDTTYLASLYVRHRYNGITDVTRYIDANTLLTTPENLSTSRSAGLELGATRRLGEKLALNFSGNLYRTEIDAANLGFAARRTAFAWDAKLNANWEATPRLRLQLATSYTARRLNAQGERHPSAVSNLGVRYNLKDKRTSFVLTVSDVFNTMKDRTTIDTPLLKGETERRRNSQVIYLGLIYNFGRSGKNDDTPEFDNTM